MEAGFVKADSDNLPLVDFNMIHEFYANNTDFAGPELRHHKVVRSARESYSDKAIGYVQLKRNASICNVRARVTPEHKISTKAYRVSAEIDEAQDTIISCECLDCAASPGGCKHGVSFLFWLHRRSEEPSVTEKTCYWKTAKLAKLKDGDMVMNNWFKKKLPSLENKGNAFLNAVLKKGSNCEGGIFDLKYKKMTPCSIHCLMREYSQNTTLTSPQGFISFLKNKMSVKDCELMEQQTKIQSKCKLWYELRYGRITASKLYDAARCKTFDGSLTAVIMGGTSPFETEATKRGLLLEGQVIVEVQKMRKISIRSVGLILNKDYPIFGASPDGISDGYCIEVKCPSKETTVANYLKDGVPTKKYYTQLQLQMFFASRDKGLFCVAHPDFEETKAVTVVDVELDREYCLEMLEIAQDFWINAIYPVLSK